MALIKCSNCSKLVSDKADKCPHCGHTLSTNKTELLRKVSASNISIISIIYGVLILVGFLCLVEFSVFRGRNVFDSRIIGWLVEILFFTFLATKDKTKKFKLLTIGCIIILILLILIISCIHRLTNL